MLRPYFFTLKDINQYQLDCEQVRWTHGAKSSGGYTPLWNRMVFAANSKNSTQSFDEPFNESLWTFDLSSFASFPSLGFASLGFASLGFASLGFDSLVLGAGAAGMFVLWLSMRFTCKTMQSLLISGIFQLQSSPLMC